MVTLSDMVAALVEAVEHLPDGVRIVEVPEIRGAARRLKDSSPAESVNESPRVRHVTLNP